jgi:HAD superfamily hydrolase (TIGR01450 family)
MGYQLYFVTNNSAGSTIKIANKLRKNGISVPAERVVNSIVVAKGLLDELDPDQIARILIIGSEDLSSEIKETGREVVGTPDCDYVLVGFDYEINYEKISLGLQAILSGAQFIACNREANYPAENGMIKPGCGAIVAAVEAASQTSPKYVVGKPEINLLRFISEKAQCSSEEMLIVGDTLESDIEMANRFSSPSVFIKRGREIKYNLVEPTISINYLTDLPEILAISQNIK